MSNRTFARLFAAALAFTAALSTGLAAGAKPDAGPKPEHVVIEGYSDDAMEPFLSRDGRLLFFNTKNEPGFNTDIHYAELQGDKFVYRGVLQGTMSYDLDAVATMSADNTFCFVSPRDYVHSRVSVLCGPFDGKRVNLAEPQKGLATERMGRLVFDVELAADGRTMAFAEGTFSGGDGPDDADLYMATMTKSGFLREPKTAKTFANINTDALEFAPALSADGLTLYFTRVTGMWPFQSPKIFRAARGSTDEPFGKPVHLKALEGYVEGPSIAPEGTLYFHKKVDGKFEIWRISAP